MATADRIHDHVKAASINQDDAQLLDILDEDALSRAAAHGDLATVRQLLAQGVNPDQLNSYGCTPLQVMKCCCADIAHSLLRAGADPNIRDPNTLVTPAHDVARAGFLKTLRCLLRHGADVTLTDRWGNSPAHVAAKHGHYDIVRYLAQGLVLSHCTNQYGLTPMDYYKTSRLDRQTREWVHKQKEEPSSLKTLSCITIRQALGPRRMATYRTLPISSKLQKCVALQHHL